MDQLLSKIKKFKSGEPMAAGSSIGSIPFLKLIPPEKHNVLVIGCGTGHEVKWLIDHGFSAQGITNNPQEAAIGKQKFGVKITVADMHNMNSKVKFDAIFASNVLEHSIAPFVALTHWQTLLKPNGWLVLVMPSQEWLSEYYHYSVLTHSQTKDLLSKTSYELLAGPQTKPKISFPAGADIFYDLGRGWGHHDGYVAKKTDSVAASRFSKTDPGPVRSNPLRNLLKLPYNQVRVWYARHHHE